MNHITSAISNRFRRLTETQLRVIYALIAVVSVIANLAIVRSMLEIRNSDDCFWQPKVEGQDSVVIVAGVIPGGSADKAGVLKGDRVLAINGFPLHGGDLSQAQRVLNEAPTDRDIPYLVEREGRRIELTIRIRDQNHIPFIELTLPSFSLLWLLIGSMVIFTRPRGLVQRRFFLAGATVVFAFSFPFSLLGSGTLVVVLRVLWGVLSILFFPLWVYFCTTFPVDQEMFVTRKRKLVLYSVTLANLLLTVMLFSFDALDIEPPEELIYVVWITFSIIGLAYFIAGAWFLYRGYRRLPPSTDRRPMRVILLGTALATVTLLYFTLIRTLIPDTSYLLDSNFSLPIILLPALPISFGYAIFKYQVMDFRMVVKTTLVYTATMILIAGLYLAISYAIGRGLGWLTGEELEPTVRIISFVFFLLLFEPVKRQVQTAIENRFFPQRRDYSEQLATYSTQITETVGTSAVAEILARTLRQGLELHGVYVLVENKDGEFAPFAKDTEFDPIEVDETAIARLRQLLRASHTIISLETVSDPLLAPLQEWFSYTIGLYAQGQAIGAVVLTRPKDDESLSGRQMQFITGVVAQGAAAIEVARLYEQELERQKYLEELSTARRIQESLLPAEMPEIPGISISAIARSAQAVGGDYYDVIELTPEKFLVIIADVSGKGLPASLYMAGFHGMIRVASTAQSTPKEILSMLNRHLAAVIARGSFITATILLFDTERKVVSMVRAGHTPIIRRQGTVVDTLIPAGIALGLAPPELFDSALQQYNVHYEPGETFILYSDGVSEAMDARYEEFGEGRLLDVISALPGSGADAICAGIMEHVEEFRNGAEQNDDVTIVVVRVEKEVRSQRHPFPSVVAIER